jgi:hypothetical protein
MPFKSRTRVQTKCVEDAASNICQAQQVLRDLAHEALEGQLADQQLGGLLVLADLAERDRAGAVPVGLLDALWVWGEEEECVSGLVHVGGARSWGTGKP